MEITVHRDNLDRALGMVERATAKNAALPILANILFTVDGAGLSLSATNLEVGITARAPAKVQKEGKIAVPGRILAELVRASKADVVNLSTQQNTLHVKAGDYQTSILCFDAAEYPIIPKLEGGAVISVDAEILHSLLEASLDSIANSDARPELAGAFLTANGSTLTIAATDSFRLIEKSTPNAGDASLSMILPRGAVLELAHVTSGLQGTVTVRVSSNQLSASHGDFELVSRLVDGKYPDYQKVIPDRNIGRALLDKDSFVNAIKVAALFSSSVSDVKLECAGSRMMVSARNASRGEGQAALDANIKGDAFDISLNHHYLLDGLKIIPTEQVIVEYTGKGSPFVLRPDDKSPLVYLIMPLRG